jgi:hypothetical protein
MSTLYRLIRQKNSHIARIAQVFIRLRDAAEFSGISISTPSSVLPVLGWRLMQISGAQLLQIMPGSLQA